MCCCNMYKMYNENERAGFLCRRTIYDVILVTERRSLLAHISAHTKALIFLNIVQAPSTTQVYDARKED